MSSHGDVGGAGALVGAPGPLIGAFAQIVSVTGESFRGELFAYDGITGTIVLRDEPRAGGGPRGVRMLHCRCAAAARATGAFMMPRTRPNARARVGAAT